MNRLQPLILCGFFVTSALHAQEPKPTIKFTTVQDFLALHVTGQAPPASTAVQYRLAISGEIPDQSAWLPAQATLGPMADFSFEVKLDSSRWSALQVRAMKGEEVLGTKATQHQPSTFTLLTEARLAALPEAQGTAWAAYLRQSKERHEADYDVIAAECRQLGLAQSKAAPGNAAELELDSDTPDAYYASAEARNLAEVVMSYQTPSGGWSKAVDYAQGPRQPGMHWTTNAENPWHYCGTIDNRTTTEQIKLLAGVYSATQNEAAKVAALRGLEYLLAAQYPNGGWPQNYPVEAGYHEAITLNDNAMVHVLEVLLTIVEKKGALAFVEEALRQRAQVAFDKGMACLAAAQVRVDGQLTVWCAQHDPISLVPVHARAKEPPSLSGGESAELLKFLMRKAPVTPATTTMIEAALAWFEQHRITGLRETKNAAGKTDYVPDSESQEVYWARFYDVQTGKPMFAGAQDGIVYATFSEMAAKNKVAYDYFTTKPGELTTKELPRWRKRLEKGK